MLFVSQSSYCCRRSCVYWTWHKLHYWSLRRAKVPWLIQENRKKKLLKFYSWIIYICYSCNLQMHPKLYWLAWSWQDQKNYTLWIRSMGLALLEKNNPGLVNGSCNQGMLVLSLISGIVAPGLVSSIVLASTANKVWDEFQERFHKSSLARIYQL